VLSFVIYIYIYIYVYIYMTCRCNCWPVTWSQPRAAIKSNWNADGARRQAARWLHQRAVHFRNAVRIHGTCAHVISFTAFPSPVFTISTEPQQHHVPVSFVPITTQILHQSRTVGMQINLPNYAPSDKERIRFFSYTPNTTQSGLPTWQLIETDR